MLDTVNTPTANWPAVPWSVLAMRTVSWRRNCHPTRRSAAIDRRLGLSPSGACPRRRRAIDRIDLVVCPGLATRAPRLPDDRRHHDRRQQDRRPEYVTASNQNASGSDEARKTHEQAGDRVVDDVRDGLAHPHRRVRRQQVALVDDARQDRDPRRPEEDRDRRDQEDQRVGEPDVDQDGDRDQQDQGRAQQVRDDEDLLLVPAVDERPGDRGEQEVRDRRHDERDRRRRWGSR